jgi:CrcB protein
MSMSVYLDYAAVAAAGFLGAAARAALSKFIKIGTIAFFPVNTLVINLTGCFFLSFRPYFGAV